MGKKKGKDKNKLARMSEEERIRYLQHRAELEEEAKRRKQQLISTFMKVWKFCPGCYKKAVKFHKFLSFLRDWTLPYACLIYASAQSFSRFLFNKKATRDQPFSDDIVQTLCIFSSFSLILFFSYTFSCHIYKFLFFMYCRINWKKKTHLLA